MVGQILAAGSKQKNGFLKFLNHFLDRIDVTEAQWSMIVIHLASALFGQSIWSTTVITLGSYSLTLSQVLALFTLATLSNAIASNALIVLFGAATPLDRLGVSIPRKHQAGFDRAVPLIPITVLTTVLAIAYSLGYYHINYTLFILTFGLTYAKLTMKLVVSIWRRCKNNSCLF